MIGIPHAVRGVVHTATSVVLDDLVFPLTFTAVATALSILSHSLTDRLQNYSEFATGSPGETFDYIVVGGGTTGAIVANRLSVNNTVILLEAGGFPPIQSSTPGLFMQVFDGPEDQAYKTTPSKNYCLSQKQGYCFDHHGKMYGGTSASNFLFMYRGKNINCDSWNLNSWDKEVCQRYYVKYEGYREATDDYHGRDGPVLISEHDGELKKTEDKFLEVLRAAGYTILDDPDDPETLGFGQNKFITGNHLRSSTFQAYLRYESKRSTLFSQKYTTVTKILFDKNKRAIGVEVKSKKGVSEQYYARKEVIVSAGTFGTAQLLMLSGIGPKDELDKLDIEVVADLPVGTAFKSSIYLPVFMTGSEGVVSALNITINALNLDTFPLACLVGEISLKNDNTPDLEVILLPLTAANVVLVYGCNALLNFEADICNKVTLANANKETLLVFLVLKNPASSGTLKLKSKNPDDPPIINLNFFGEKSDLDRFVAGAQKIADLVNYSYLKDANSKVVDVDLVSCKSFSFGSPEYWACYVRHMGLSFNEPIATTPMGNGAEAVVDDRAKVLKVEGLRAVSTSSIPKLVSGDLMPLAMMFAERISDLILEDNS